MVETSNFRRCKGDPRCVAISARVPKNYNGRRCKKLAPPYWMVQKSKSGEMIDEEFKREYKRCVLDKLDAHDILAEIGDDAILLCWEWSGKFCHRTLVAKWLSEELGIEVKERESER
jgi:uncharacterized protein (DUF488 family)